MMVDPASMGWQALLSGLRYARRSIDKFDDLEVHRPDLSGYAAREKARFVQRLEALELEWERRTGARP